MACELEALVLHLRGSRIILDTDLAVLYGTTTKRLNEQVKRNSGRFPDDFMFQLNNQEASELRSQFATAKWTMRRSNPHAFTEHGAMMTANVLNSLATAGFRRKKSRKMALLSETQCPRAENNSYVLIVA